MTIVTNAFETYTQVGIKENVKDVISNITPDETPFYSQAKKFKVHNRTHQWQTDNLRIPAQNAQIEVDAVSAGASSATVMLNNSTQISYIAAAVTDTARAVDTYGRGDEYDYQLMKRGKILKTDIEFVLLANVRKQTGDAASGRRSAGLPTWIANAVAQGSQSSSHGGDGTGSGIASTTSSSALTYESLASAMQLAYEDGGDPTIMMLPPALKRRFSSLAFAATPSTADVRYNITKPSAVTAVGSVEAWLSDFGSVDVVPNRQMARSANAFLLATVYLIDPNHYRVGELQPLEIIPLAKTGLADVAVLRSEYVLEVDAPDAHAMVIGAT